MDYEEIESLCCIRGGSEVFRDLVRKADLMRCEPERSQTLQNLMNYAFNECCNEDLSFVNKHIPEGYGNFEEFLSCKKRKTAQKIVVSKVLFPTWNKVSLGTIEIGRQFLLLFNRKGCRTRQCQFMIENLDFSNERVTSASLALVSVHDLGFQGGAMLCDIYTEALNMGLEICPAWVAPCLRLEDPEQYSDKVVYVGIDPIEDNDGLPRIFGIARYDKDNLIMGCCGHQYSFYREDKCFVFVKKTSHQ